MGTLTAIRKLKGKFRKLTGRSNGMSLEQRKTKLKQLIRGWVNYFKLARMRNILAKLVEMPPVHGDVETLEEDKYQVRELKESRLGQKVCLASTRNKYWYVASSPWLKIALPNRMCERAGYLTLSACYAKIK